MSHVFFLAAAVVLAASPIAAQAISAEFSPNPVQPGVPVAFTITDATGQGLNLPSPCGWYSVFSGSQSGTEINLGQMCLQVIVPVAPGGSATFTWNQRDGNNTQVTPGRYWFRARAWDSGFSQQYTDWFCLSILNPGEPALTAAGPVQLGQTTALQIAAPQDPGAIYFAAVAFSSNAPVTVLGLETCLSQPIFADPLSVPFGALDGQGNSAGLAISIPNLPFLLRQGLHVQALLIGGAGPKLTNDLSLTLR